MTLVSQWRQIEAGLPPDWEQARIGLEVADDAQLGRAGFLLGPLAPGRSGSELHFSVVRGGSPGAEAVRRLLARLDDERIGGALVLSGTAVRTESPETPPARNLTATWDELVATLPEDWSDLLCQLELTSTDDLARAALLTAPLNPAREHGESPGFRFRVARIFGYGTSPGMTRRCFARLDEDSIPGDVRVLRVLSDTRPVFTQGPVWYIGGKAV